MIQGLVLESDTAESIEQLETELSFSPTKGIHLRCAKYGIFSSSPFVGNVVFSSAIHGYAFGVEDFSEFYAEKLKIPKKELTNALFGDFYIAGGKIKV